MPCLAQNIKLNENGGEKNLKIETILKGYRKCDFFPPSLEILPNLFS